MLSKLHYPKRLVDSSINTFSQEPDKEIHPLPSADPSVYIVLPFKDQRSVDRVRRDIYSLGAKIDVNAKPIFTSKKLLQTLSVKENKPPIVNTQCVVYLFQCDLFDANYVGYTARHLHQRIGEHRYSAIGKHCKPTPFAPNCLRDTCIHFYFYYYCYFSFCVSYTHRTRKHFM